MKTYQITVNGQEYTVEIEDPFVSPVKVTVDGKSFEVTVSQQGAQGNSGSRMAAPSTPSKAPPPPDHETLLDTYVPVVASTYVATTEMAPESTATEARGPAEETATDSVREGAETVTAPMPGTILDIVVKAGDVVQQGDTLCNLEAMKMKSPIRSPIAGAVAQVLINEGQNVSHGDVLFTLQP